MPSIKLTVHNPTGAVEVTGGLAPRVKDLHGKKVGMVWNERFRGDEILPYVKQLLQERFPDTEVVAYEDMPLRIPFDTKTLGQVIKQMGFDAIIGGNGA